MTTTRVRVGGLERQFPRHLTNTGGLRQKQGMLSKNREKNRIRFALIGCGRVATRHCDALKASRYAELVGVADLDGARAQQLGETYDVPYFTNYHAMLAAVNDVDVVSIITPSGVHFDHAVDLLDNYPVHVMIEKPVVMTPDQGEKLRALAQAKKKSIFPVFQNRFNKAVQRVRAGMQDGGELGNLRVGTVRMRWCRPQRYYDLSQWRGRWSMDGGALTNQGIHYIDILRYLGGDVKRVCAKAATLGANIEVEDTAVAVLEFQSGALGVIEAMTSARPDDFEASVSCVGAQGLAVISGIATNELQTFSPAPQEAGRFSEVFPTVYGFGHNSVVDQVGATLLALAKGETPNTALQPVTFEDALGTIDLLHAIYRSDEIGTWVDLKDRPRSTRLGRPEPARSQPYLTPFQK